METRIPRTATRRQAGDWAKILSGAKRSAFGFGFEGEFVRPGKSIDDGELYLPGTDHRFAILLECAGSEGRRDSDYAYILWRYDGAWRELARAQSRDSSWTRDLAPIAIRALHGGDRPAIPEACAVVARIAWLLDGELETVEEGALSFVLGEVHNQLATRIVYAGGRVQMTKPTKDPAAVSLGRRGGKAGGSKGGKARAAALTAKERTAIARKAGLASGRARAKTAKT